MAQKQSNKTDTSKERKNLQLRYYKKAVFFQTEICYIGRVLKNGRKLNVFF